MPIHCSGDVKSAYWFSKPGVRVQVPSGASGHLRSWREGHLTRAFDLWGRLTAHLGERLFYFIYGSAGRLTWAFTVKPQVRGLIYGGAGRLA